jgi:hypothetical protein
MEEYVVCGEFSTVVYGYFSTVSYTAETSGRSLRLS